MDREYVTQTSSAQQAAVLSKALANAAMRLKLGTTDLQRITGISQSSASRLMNGKYQLRENAKEWELAALLIRLYRGLHSIVGNNDALARDWLNSPNKAFGGLAPIRVIEQASGLVHACDYIDAHRAAS